MMPARIVTVTFNHAIIRTAALPPALKEPMMTQALHTPTPQRLINTINRMDADAQQAFGDIATLARNALGALDSLGSTGPHAQAIRAALDSVWFKAEDAGNRINAGAEEVGCNYVQGH